MTPDEQLVSKLNALASEKRIRILRLLREIERLEPPGWINTTFIADNLHLSLQLVSRHLDTLERSGLVARKRVGSYALYSIPRGVFEDITLFMKEIADGPYDETES